MKKSLVTLVVVLIASINISAFEINTDDSVMNQLANDATSSSTSVFLEAVTEETGYVDSMFGVHIANGDSENPILLGEETVGMMTKENRPIFTFDTSGIPATACAVLTPLPDVSQIDTGNLHQATGSTICPNF